MKDAHCDGFQRPVLAAEEAAVPRNALALTPIHRFIFPGYIALDI